MDFRNSAINATSGSEIMEGRNKINTDDLIVNYPDGITIIGFDYLTDDTGETYPVIKFSEDDTKFFFGGCMFKTICDAWISEFDNNIDATSKALGESGGVKVKLALKKSNSGRTYCNVDIL